MTATFSPFSTEHQYVPDLVLFAENLNVSPKATVIPSLIHVIFGAGFPVAVQWRVVSSPSLTVWSTGFEVKLGGTAKYIYTSFCPCGLRQLNIILTEAFL